MSDYFPFLSGDLLVDILVRLPAETLVRCTSVCKSWHSLITNPSFITKHLNRSKNNHLLLVRSYTDPYVGDDKEHYSLRYDNERFLEYAELDLPLKSICSHYFRIIGSINGLICLSDDQFRYVNDLFLWNPSIRKVFPLPPVRVTFQSHGPFVANIGFGFDSITDDYKVIRIVHFENDYRQPPEIDIFSLSTGTWRNISHLALPNINVNELATQAFLKGAAHWVASSTGMHTGRFLIVSFHMGREEFGQIMLPHNTMAHARGFGSFLMTSDLYFRVAKFQESLALIHFTGPENKTCCIWVMQEYGVVESWTKKFYFDMVGTFNTLAGFTRKGELLLSMTNGYLVAYDPQAGRLTHLSIRGTTDQTYKYSLYANAYTGSLVLLGKRFCDTGTSEESSPGAGAVEGGSGADEIKKNRFVSWVENENEETSEDGEL